MKRWSKEDIQFLRDNYNKMRNKELAKILNTTENAVRFQACSHNIKKSDCITRVWNKEKDDYIRKNYQNNSNESIAKALGVSYYAVSHRAKALNVRKSDDYINKLHDKYEYRKGHVPFTKGKKMSDYMSSEKIERVKSTQFKKGDPVYNHKEEGNEHLLGTNSSYKPPYEPKNGDFIVLSLEYFDLEHIAIFKGYEDFGYIKIYVDNDMEENCFYRDCSLRLATEEEKQQLLGILHKKGKDWDALNKKLIDYKWKPKNGTYFNYITPALYIERIAWNDKDSICNNLYKAGNCFRHEAEAVKIRNKIEKILKNEY